MIDYRNKPLGMLGSGRIGEIVECPYCHERALKVEDYKDPLSGSTEKESVYIHLEGARLHRKIENGRTVDEWEIVSKACPVKFKLKSPEETLHA